MMIADYSYDNLIDKFVAIVDGKIEQKKKFAIILN